MSLLFTNNSTDAIDHGSAADIDDLSAFTFWAWVYPTTIASDRFLLTKVDGTGFNGILLKFYGTGQMSLLRDRATTEAACDTATNTVSTNAWQFVAATFDVNGADAASTVNLYHGDLSTQVTEVSTNQQQGSGALVSEAAGALRIGSYEPFGGGESFAGRIACYGLVNRYLSLGQIQALQWRPLTNMSGCLLLVPAGRTGHGSQTDLSGNGRTGTEVGTVGLGDPAPLPSAWGWDLEAGGFAVGGGSRPPSLTLLGAG